MAFTQWLGVAPTPFLTHSQTIQLWNEWIKTYQNRGGLNVIHSLAVPGAYLTLECKEGSNVSQILFYSISL